MAPCCQNLTLGVLSRRNALSVLVGALFKKLGPFKLASYVDFKPFNAGIKSFRATLPDEIFYWEFCFLKRAFT
jgi:hypothetical protein